MNSPRSYCLPCPHRRCVHRQDDAADDVGCGFGNEGVAVQLRGKTIAAIDHRRAHRRELREGAVGTVDAFLIRAVGAWIRTDWPHHIDRLVAELFVAATRAGEVGIARVVRRRHEVDVQRLLVRIPEDASGVVMGHAPLAPDQRVADFELIGLKPQVDVAVGGVDPVVESPVEIVGVFLDPSFATTVPVRHELPRVSMEVAVRVAHQPQVWRLAD